MLSLQKVVAVTYERFQLQAFDWEKFGVLDRWSLMGGGRLREGVAHGGSTVCKLCVFSSLYLSFLVFNFKIIVLINYGFFF